MLNLKDKLVTQVSEELGMEESLVDKIICWVYKDTVKATKLHNEIEMNGFGKFFISLNKLNKHVSNIEKSKYKEQNDPTGEGLALLKKKQDEIKLVSDNRGAS